VRRARRRRLALRGRAGIVLAVALSCVAAGGALAQSGAPPSGSGASSSSTSVRAIQKKLGLKPDGVYGRKTRAAVKRFQRAHGLTADGVVGPQTLAALGLGSSASDAEESSAGGDASTVLQSIAQCESGGDPTAVSADGTYRGKYQFSRSTWQQLGGSGDPAQASEAEQDSRAAQLYASSGSTPWPTCG
jgi:peptidoglycan hydrolase-like protein with peptidoglycan-binding domain